MNIIVFEVENYQRFGEGNYFMLTNILQHEVVATLSCR